MASRTIDFDTTTVYRAVVILHPMPGYRDKRIVKVYGTYKTAQAALTRAKADTPKYASWYPNDTPNVFDIDVQALTGIWEDV